MWFLITGDFLRENKSNIYNTHTNEWRYMARTLHVRNLTKAKPVFIGRGIG